MQFIIAGDLGPTKSNEDLFINGDINALIGSDLNEIWASTDIRVFNLEVPLTDQETPISKYGPNLIAPTSTINGIAQLNPSLVTLANNHIMDQGTKGLYSTQSILQHQEIPFVGIGDNVHKASEPYIFNKDGISIGIYACAENEFTIATDDTPGANPFDPLVSLDQIQMLKSKCDYVIVLYHGGKEHYRYPSPYLQKVCRKIVEKGADLVVCQHSHCIGCYEEINESTIIYGQGNFIFDRSDSEFWKTSLLIKVGINNGLHVEYIPIIKVGNGVRLAVGKEAKNILEAFYQRSNEIIKNGFIEQKFQEFALENKQKYLRKFVGFGNWLSRLDRKLLNGMLVKKIYSEEKLLAIQNYIECEAHRELMLASLKKEIKNRKK